jgi:prolyl-tRNA synthetase
MGVLVEVYNDEKGMIWPESVAPFQVHLISLCKDGDAKKADEIYENLVKKGIEVLYDDRNTRAGEKFADSDLIGIPKRIVVSTKTLEKNSVEVKMRNEEKSELVEIEKL